MSSELRRLKIEPIHIYLSGAITGIPFEEANEWRDKITDSLRELGEPNIHIFNPAIHFTELQVQTGIATNKDIMLTELNKLRKSDYVIYNCHYPGSLGSMAELAIAYERNIPILAFNNSDQELHPWIKEMCTRVFNTEEEMIHYFINHCLYYD